MIVKIGEPITSAGVMPSLLAPLNWMNSLKSVGLAVELGRYFPCSIRIAKLPVSIGNCSMRYYSTSMRGFCETYRECLGANRKLSKPEPL